MTTTPNPASQPLRCSECHLAVVLCQCHDYGSGHYVFDEPHERVAARYPVQPSPARGDMPQECEDCGRSMTRCICSPARSDKDARIPEAFNDWWNTDKDTSTNPFDEDTFAFWAWEGWKACSLAESAPSGEVSFDAFWSDEVARNGGHGFGADYKHWARKGFDAARRATAGTTAAPSGEPDQDAFEAQAKYQGATNFTLVHPEFLVCNNGWFPATYRDPMTELAWRVWANKPARRATAGNAAPTEAEAVEGGASALRAEPAGRVLSAVADLTDEEISEMCFRVQPYDFPGGGGNVDYLRYDAAVVRAVVTELATRCRAEGGVTCNNSSSELASNTATAAPGDLPREWVQKTWFDCNQDVFAFTREVLASNAGAAPGDAKAAELAVNANRYVEVVAAFLSRAPERIEAMYYALTLCEWWEDTDKRVDEVIATYAAPSNPPVGAHESERKAP